MGILAADGAERMPSRWVLTAWHYKTKVELVFLVQRAPLKQVRASVQNTEAA
jgi:hypothetical protein